MSMFNEVTPCGANPCHCSRMWFILIVCAWAVSLTAPATAQLDRFGPPQIVKFAGPQAPSLVTAADLDGDGDADVLAGSGGENSIVWYENRLLEEEQDIGPPQIISAMGDTTRSLVTADLDGDGDLDILAYTAIQTAPWNDAIVWYENRLTEPEEDFGPQQVISTRRTERVFAADIDGDGDSDVISASRWGSTNAVTWLENKLNEDESFGPHQLIAYAMGRSLFADDLDGDGDMDVLFATFGEVSWSENRLTESEGDFAPIRIIDGNNRQKEFVIAQDLDGDGDADILSASLNYFDRGIVWHENRLSEAEGDFYERQEISHYTDGANCLFTADLDGDGDADILSGSYHKGTITWYENRLTEKEKDFGPKDFVTSNASEVQSVFAIDLDEDGDADVLSASEGDNKIVWYDNKIVEEDDFAPEKIIDFGVIAFQSVFDKDLDGDGDSDLLSISQYGEPDKIIWSENRLAEQGEFSPLQVITTEVITPTSVYAVDIDGDGDADALSASYSDDKIAWYENRLAEDEKDFGSQQVISTDADGARSVFAVDLDGDGDADVLSASFRDNKIAWYDNRLSEPEEDFGPQEVISLNVDSPTFVYATDLNGDGYADVLAHSLPHPIEGSPKVYWFENNLRKDQRSFGPQTLIGQIGDGFGKILCIDIDGDGDQDLITVSARTDTVAWYENRLAEVEKDFAPLQVIYSHHQLSETLFAGDIDGDGDPDLLSALSTGRFIYEIELMWHENRLSEGDENFRPHQALTYKGPYRRFVSAPDLNGDGRVDILSIFRGIGWYENTGSGFALRSKQGWEPRSVESLPSPDFSHDEDQESLLIESITNDSLYGLWESPSVSIDPVEEASVFRTRWRLSSSIDPPRYVPTIRLRTSTEDFSRSDLLVATSAGPGIFSPRYYDTDYTQYSTQPLAPQDYRFSFEMLNVDSTDAAEGSVSLHYLQIDQLAQSRLGNSQVVLDHNFETATGASLGWESYSDFSGTFPAPEEFSDQNGLLIRGVVPSSERVPYYEPLQFGYWNTQTDLLLTAGKTYRVRYTVASDATEAERAFVPTFRLRASDSSFMMGHVVNIDSVNAEADIPVAGEVVTYDLWFLCPEAVDGNDLNLSFDYLYVDKDTPDADDPTIALTLKRVEVEEWGK